MRTDVLRFVHGVAGGAEKVAALGPDDHLLCYPDKRILFRLHPRVRCRISLMVAEPPGIQRQVYCALRLQWWRYFRVLTYHPTLLSKLRNARFLPFGTAWVPTDRDHLGGKTRHMSLIASPKAALEGHRLRHRIAEWVRRENLPVDLLGYAYTPLDLKSEGLAPYRFSVVIENSREPGYFTEKLLDAFFCDTIPVYWGAPDVARFFDPRGMVVCESEEAVRQAVASLTAADYEERIPFLRANRQAALAFVDYEKNAADIVLREAARES